VHGPTPRSYEFRLSKKMRKGALASALSAKSGEESFLVIEGMDSATGKTRDAVKLLKAIGVEGEKVLVIIPNEATEQREKFARGLQNIERVSVVPSGGVNVYDLVNSAKVLCVRAALSEIEARVGKSA
jgi:large subunit ribosomal protein L4